MFGWLAVLDALSVLAVAAIAVGLTLMVGGGAGQATLAGGVGALVCLGLYRFRNTS